MNYEILNAKKVLGFYTRGSSDPAPRGLLPRTRRNPLPPAPRVEPAGMPGMIFCCTTQRATLLQALLRFGVAGGEDDSISRGSEPRMSEVSMEKVRMIALQARKERQRE